MYKMQIYLNYSKKITTPKLLKKRTYIIILKNVRGEVERLKYFSIGEGVIVKIISVYAYHTLFKICMCGCVWCVLKFYFFKNY